MRNKILGGVLGAVLLVLLATPRKASAYVDPGSGAMLWQMLAAGFIGTLFYMRRVATFTRKHLRIKSPRVMGFIFATIYAIVASPVMLTIFHAKVMPRFNDIFLVGVVLTAYLFTWEPAVYLLVISTVVSVYMLPPAGVIRVSTASDIYRLVSFVAVTGFLVILIIRLKSSADRAPATATVLEPAAEIDERVLVNGR